MAEPKKRGKKWHGLVYDYTDANGKRKYKSITASTKAEWYMLRAEFEKERALSASEREEKKNRGLTVGEAVDAYIERQRPLCSPTTIAGYEKIRELRFRELMERYVGELSREDLESAIRAESLIISTRGRPLAPKTVNSAISLVNTAISEICGISFPVHFLKNPNPIIDLPDPREVLEVIRGSSVELPCLLAMWLSFSLSEVRGLKCSSIRADKIFIDQVKVRVNNADVVKNSGKTNSRLRVHSIPGYIMELIERQETYRKYMDTGEDSFLIDLSFGQLLGRYKRLMAKNNLNISFHKLRHMSASIMAMLDIPARYAQERGGWSTDYTMKRVYQHTFSTGRQAADDKVNAFFDMLLNGDE